MTTAAGGEPLQIENLVRCHHELAVDLETGDGAGHRPRCEDDVLAFQLGPAIDGDDLARPERSGTDEGGHLALLHQTLQALPELVDDLLLAGLGLGELHRRCVHRDPELLRAYDGPVDARRLEELLGRDAAPMKAGAPHLLLLDHCDLQAGQAATQGGCVPCRTAANDHDIELLGRRNHLLGTHQS